MLTVLLKYIRLVSDDRRGVTALEYGLIAALVAVVIIGAVTKLGSGLSSSFDRVSTNL